MVKTKNYIGIFGSTGFNDPELAYSTILKVTRSGLAYNKISGGEPAGLQFLYLQDSGGIFFDPNNPFNFTAREDIHDHSFSLWQLEQISVKFKQ